MLTEIKNESEHHFTDEQGLYHGEYKTWSDGRIQVHCFFTHGFRDGEYKDWFVSGELWEHSFYKDDKRHGSYKLWHMNGALVEHLHFNEGVLEGEQKEWDEDGVVVQHFFCANDTDITNEIKSFVADINNITDEERIMLKLKYNFSLC